MVTVRRETSKKRAVSSPKPKATKSGFLGQVDSASADEDVGISLVIYGKEGVGKTSLAAYAPSPLFLVDKQEHGVHRLKKRKLIPSTVKVGPDIETWQGLLDALDEILESEHDYETIVLDSLTGFQRICFAECARIHYDGNLSKEGFFAYNNGPKVAAQEFWPELIGKLTDLQNQNINTILIGHTTVKPYNNPTGPDFDRIMADVEKPIWAATSKWAGAVLYYEHVIDLSKDGRKTKASGGEMRHLCCEFDAAYDAKNSYNLPPVLNAFGSAKECWDDLWSRIAV